MATEDKMIFFKNKRIIHKALQSHSQFFNEISILHLLDQYTVRMIEHDWTNTSGLLLLINQENTQELWFVSDPS